MQDAMAPAESLGDVLLARELKKIKTLAKKKKKKKKKLLLLSRLALLLLYYLLLCSLILDRFARDS